jgi:O-antigen/teichoic acid export membrane protein
MLKQATGTVLSRVFVAAMNLLVMVLAGHAFGAAGLGTIGLVVLGITLVMLPANLIGGGALVYLVPRIPLTRLVWPAYAWATVSALLAWVVLRSFALVPAGYEAHVCALALLQAVYSVHFGVLLGQQRIARHNAISAVHAAVLLVTFAALLYAKKEVDVMAYVQASYAAFGLTALLSAFAIDRRSPIKAGGPVVVLRVMLRQGLWVQGANGLQLLNYRLAYWIIEHVLGRAALGLYSVGTQLAESAWIAPRSLGMVLVSRVSNLDELAQQRRLTLLTAKVAISFALAVVLVLAVLPDAVFRLAFGDDITGLRPIVLLLAPGIMSMSASQAFSHYFSGKGQNRHNLIGSGLGMLITAGFGWWAIPHWGLKGAALIASLAYTASVVYQWAVFSRRHNARLAELWPDAEDVGRLRDLWRTMVR